MKKKTEEKDYWFCGRCDLNTVDNTDQMCPCPRGGCEAEVIGKIITTTEVVLINKYKPNMTPEQFNEKYKEYIEEGFEGLEIDNIYAINYLDKVFQELILIPGFKFSQIKYKFGTSRFYCDNVPREKINEMEIELNKFV